METQTESMDNKPSHLPRLIKLAAPEKWIIFIATIALFVSSGTQMLVPAMFGRLIEIISTYQTRAELNLTVFYMILIFTVSSVFSFIRGALFTLSGERLVARFRTQVFDAIINQDVSFFDKNQSGELQSRLSNDSSVIQNAVTTNVSMGLRWSVQILVGIGIIFYISWKLTLLMLAIVPPLAIATRKYGSFVRDLSKQYQEGLADAGEVAEEAFSGIRTVRSFAKEDYELERYSESIQKTFEFGKKKSWAYGAFLGGVSFTASLAMAAVLWYGGLLVIENSGELSASQLTSFLLYTIYIAVSLGGLSGLYSTLMSAVGASERLFALIDRVPDISSRPNEKGAMTGVVSVGEIQFKNVSFSYPSRPESEILKAISFTCQPGKVTAIVGSSGGGKSTILSLLQRFYTPTSGKILIDGHDLGLLEHRYLHKSISIVSQEPQLFASSIRQNICYGIEGEVSESEYIAASKQANAHDFISQFPNAYDTHIGERGVQLSGGQKQRIAIARAILMNPKVLLLDEATSALDSESERLVQQALDRIMLNRTTIVVAHRLSTVRHADQILVIGQGQILEIGEHDALIEANNHYASLVKHQLS